MDGPKNKVVQMYFSSNVMRNLHLYALVIVLESVLVYHDISTYEFISIRFHWNRINNHIDRKAAQILNTFNS